MKRLLLFVLLGVTASAASAQTPADTVRPFVPGGVYDKPYLGRLFGRTAIGGYAEAHARLERADGAREHAGFELKRWNLFTATQVNDFIRIGAELEIEELGEEVKLEYAAIDFTVHPSFAFRAGAILSPLGRFNLSHDSPRNEFTDRPLVSTDILGVALTEPGLGALGQFGLAGTARVTYELYAVNGFHDGIIDDSPDGVRIPQGRGNHEDNNGSPAFVGRVTFSPRFGYELGVSAHHGAYNDFAADGAEIEARRDLSIFALDGEATLAGATISGEAVIARIDLPASLSGLYADAQRGMYLQAVRPFGTGWIGTMPSAFFEARIRLEAVDFDSDRRGDSVKQATLGVNFRPTAETAIKLDFVRGRSRDRFNNAGEHAGLLFSMATYF
jgi:hypothetical protein